MKRKKVRNQTPGSKSEVVKRATYTVHELAALIGRHHLSVYRALKAGRIPAQRLGKKYILSRSVIQKWLERDTVSSAA